MTREHQDVVPGEVAVDNVIGMQEMKSECDVMTNVHLNVEMVAKQRIPQQKRGEVFLRKLHQQNGQPGFVVTVNSKTLDDVRVTEFIKTFKRSLDSIHRFSARNGGVFRRASSVELIVAYCLCSAGQIVQLRPVYSAEGALSDALSFEDLNVLL